MPIKNNLRHLLIDRDMSIRQLSEEIGITYSMVYNFAMMKQRSVSFSVLATICDKLGVQPGDILIYEPDEK
ncbi:MAG: helix-turn-helix transcriptional regulator [Anaerolineales bacterium]|nr:helix-turn-helix transcriptional regulator [Anaerolineales bacterium]MCA9928804.1 helix-turn-helix transcriptional regulator [Anaerolineales bacterium]